MAQRAGLVSAADFREQFDRFRGKATWGPSDRLGTLNYISSKTQVAAAGEVRLGKSVSLAAPIEHAVTADNPEPCQLEMKQTGADAPEDGLSFALDHIGMNVHGNADTHLDALCHVIYDGKLYNDMPADTVTDSGALDLSVGVTAQGIVGRGVLLDVPKTREVLWLEPGDHVTADDLANAEKSQDVQVGEGDMVFVRVGHRLRRKNQGPWDAAAQRAGLGPGALEFLADRKISLLGSDGNNDTAPSLVEGVDFPVHVLAIAGMGLRLIDYMEYSDALPVCNEIGRWSFLCVIAPLRLRAATGSPVNPIAVF
jgi:kynurenine formamidase